ncbi:ATP-grasp domain-containing protein [Streptomyces sp. A3M-1-3]|uniref:ATP-grasp domain-containing protein n=1 Tax=Streptomyces sp. A3M-1-3 TaxID=2962044 RepID=UPI0020B66A3B|nr:ATP-grasp domain-containing protein [Streptomyces sp. A3M-1-3]MCP3819182.1 ATP-grasp domain-containing protein [Streptomyces sp. A3M-1-3]
MKILVLHRVPYPKIAYHRGIDHDLHDVTYFGRREALASLPAGLRCEQVERTGLRAPYDEARAWLDDRPQTFDRVISMSEYELIDAARLREHLGIEGTSVEQVMLARDKVLMKEAVERVGLRVPRFLPVEEFLGSGGRSPWTGATVLKPHRGASSVDVVVFDSAAQAHEAIAARRTGVPSIDEDGRGLPDHEVEEFVEGKILHFDGLVEKGVVLALGASEYVGTCLDYAHGVPMGSFQFEVADDARDWVTDALAAVRIEDGSFHLEAIVDGTELVFLEVGNRVGGADVVDTFELATGIHLPSFELRILLGEPTAGTLPEPPAERAWYGWFVYPGHHLGDRVFEGFGGAEPFRSAPEVVTWHELPLGAPLPDHITYGAHETALAGIAATSSPEVTRSWMTRLFASLTLRTSTPRVPEPATPDLVA